MRPMGLAAHHAAGVLHDFVVAGSVEFPGASPFNISLAGIHAGDIAVMYAVNNSGAVVLTGGTTLGSLGGTSNTSALSYKIVSAGDAVNGYLSSAGNSSTVVMVAVYRGPTVATWKTWSTNSPSTASPVVCPGFTKSGSSKVVLFGFLSAGASPQTPTTSGATTRVTTATGQGLLADYDLASGYTNTNTQSFGYGTLADVFTLSVELT